MTKHDSLLVDIIVNGPFMENCYLVAEEGSRKALLLDPGDEDKRILEEIRRLDLDVQEIVCTHTHVDHAGAVATLKRLLGVPFAAHALEREALKYIPHQASLFGLSAKEVPEMDRELTDGETLLLGGLKAQVIHTPGHTAGGCCIYFAPQRVIFVGDTLFAGSIGRTDLPGGSLTALLASIRDKLLCLPDDVVVYSGHGPETDLATERRSNPFLQPGAPIF